MCHYGIKQARVPTLISTSRCGNNRWKPWHCWPRFVIFVLGSLLLVRFSKFQLKVLSAPNDARSEMLARHAETSCHSSAVSAGLQIRQSVDNSCFPLSRTRSQVRTRKYTEGPPLHIFLRVAAEERAYSGGRRYLGLRKTPIILSTLASLRLALESFVNAGPSLDDMQLVISWPTIVNITVIYDGLQNDVRREEAWRLAVETLLCGGWDGPFPVFLHHVMASTSGSTVGNRATNLLQYRLFRELPCAVASATSSSLSSDSDTRVYFVEDDYIHAPSAFVEMLDSLSLPWLDGTEPARFVTPFDHPDRLRASGLNSESSFIKGGARRAWRSQSSTTMTFASRCSDAFRILPTLEALAPEDFIIWPRLQWIRFAGFIFRERPENRLMGPTTSLALHATAGDVPYYSPPGTGFKSWCEFILCLRDSAAHFLHVHEPGAFAILNATMF